MNIKTTNERREIRLTRQDLIQFAGVGKKLADMAEVLSDTELAEDVRRAIVTLCEVRSRFGIRRIAR